MSPQRERPGMAVHAEKERQARALELLLRKKTIPDRCGFCRSSLVEPGVKEEVGHYVCDACGRRTPVEMVHRLRQQEIRAYIARGVV